MTPHEPKNDCSARRSVNIKVVDSYIDLRHSPELQRPYVNKLKLYAKLRATVVGATYINLHDRSMGMYGLNRDPSSSCSFFFGLLSQQGIVEV